MTKEHPILFKTPMVQAIMEGRKTQTRRVVKKVALEVNQFGKINYSAKNGFGQNVELEDLVDPFMGIGDYFPYGKVGDLLWVRETLYQEGELGIKYMADDEWIDEEKIPEIPFKNGPYGGDYSFRAIPNIHMPKWASRIWLEITNIKVERLQDISEEDAKAEGIEPMYSLDGIACSFRDYQPLFEQNTALPAKKSFQTLWQSINGPENWDANPWVWVIEFKRIEK